MKLYTKDLLLRTVTNDDINEVSRMWDFGNGSISLEDAKKAIDYMIGNHAKNQAGNIYHLCLAVFERKKDSIIGWCGLDGKNDGELNIFYLIDENYRNRGFASQCAEILLSYAFDEAEVPFVNGGCDKKNTASFRVMEKAGMNQIGFEKNGDPVFFIDAETYHNLKVKN